MWDVPHATLCALNWFLLLIFSLSRGGPGRSFLPVSLYLLTFILLVLFLSVAVLVKPEVFPSSSDSVAVRLFYGILFV